MSYKPVRAYLFSKSYAYSVFQEHIHIAKRKNKARIRRRLKNILLLGQTLNADNSLHIQSLVRKDERLVTYIRIEKELTRLAKERNERGEFDLEEYEYALLDPAIERVAGESISDVEDDKVFDIELVTRKALYQHWYYQTAAKYRLPTLRILPFLLRLIVN